MIPFQKNHFSVHKIHDTKGLSIMYVYLQKTEIAYKASDFAYFCCFRPNIKTDLLKFSVKFSYKILLGIIGKLSIWRRFLSSWGFSSLKHEDFFVFLRKKSGFGFPYFSFWKTVFGNAWYKWDPKLFGWYRYSIQFCLKKACMERKTQKSDFGAILPSTHQSNPPNVPFIYL